MDEMVTKMPRAERPIRVTRKGQATLPKEFRDLLGVQEGI
jgi:bifunctional DNA-binding transcriptional regulator/antitoxin component of YhaV-PrlF toxin-antitoxin module